MKIRSLIICIICCVTIFSCNKESVTEYAAIEQYPDDTILNSVVNKTAMIVTAHDDDMLLTAGTASKLNKEGWQIISVCFRNEKPERNTVHMKAAEHVLDSVIFIEVIGKAYRNDISEGVLPHTAIPRSEFSKVFNYKNVEKPLLAIINHIYPTVIFTLDNEIGGYGHPGHVFISQLVLDLAMEKKINPQYIYQSVMTPHMAATIIEERHNRRMKSWGYAGDGWETARKVYQVDGMPLPNTQIFISSEAENKMKYLRSYNERERKTMGFFLPAFEEYEADEYFQIFDREFFRVIKIN
ncbi:MAG: PIG-L family deacetylase [Candidatus Cyclobacteriaceae bacterium M2_1C_046]